MSTNENIDVTTEETKDIENDTVKIFNPKTEKGAFKVDCWHNEKNGDITPRDINKRSKKAFWFTCDVCNHDFQRTIRNIYVNNKWCPYCEDGEICDNDDCEMCYNQSFASLGE